MKERSIKRKLQFIIIGVAFGLAVLIFLTSIVQMYSQKRTIELTNVDSSEALSKETKNNLEDMNRQVARDVSQLYNSRINQNFQQIRKNVEAVAAYMHVLYQYNSRSGVMDDKLGIMPGVRRQTIEKEFLAIRNIRDFINSLPDYDSNTLEQLDLYIATKSGMCLDGTNGAGFENVEPGQYSELRDTTWYTGARLAGENQASPYFWTSMFTGMQSKKDKINCAVPFYDGHGRFAGVAAGDITKEHIKSAVLEINDEQLDYIILFNENNQVMLNPYDYERLDSLNISDEVMLQDDYMITFTVLPENGWKLCLIFRQDSIKNALSFVEDSIGENGGKISFILAESIKRSILVFAVIASAGAALALVVANVAAGTFVRPIKQLMEQVKEVGSGNLDRKITVASRDEIGRLAVCFDTMTGELRNYMEHVRTMTADQERTAAELNVARQIQKNMLPHHYPAYPDRKELDIYGRTQTSKEGGGNFYDFFFADKRHFCFMAGNASGEGILTTLMAVIAKTHIKNFAQSGYPLNRILTETNNQLSAENETGRSVSVFLGLLDIESGVLDYCNAGLPAPFWKHSGEEFEPVGGRSCFPLGIMGNVPYAGRSAALVQGDLLCLYTEGLARTKDGRENEYTDEHFQVFLNEAVKWEFGLEAIVDATERELSLFREGKESDLDWTVLLLRFFG